MHPKDYKQEYQVKNGFRFALAQNMPKQVATTPLEFKQAQVIKHLTEFKQASTSLEFKDTQIIILELFN